MVNIKERVSYLKGLCDGLDINESTKEGKLLIAMIDVIDEMAEEIDDMVSRQDEVEDYINVIDEDLERVEEELYEDEEDDEDGFIELECPNCGDTIYLDEEMLEEGEEVVCPNCNESLELECDCCCGDHECDCGDENHK